MLFRIRLLDERSVKSLRLTFVFCCKQIWEFCFSLASARCISWPKVAGLNSGCISYATTSPTLKQMHIDLRVSVSLMAILCFVGERVLNREKSDRRHSDVNLCVVYRLHLLKIRCISRQRKICINLHDISWNMKTWNKIQ